MTVKILIVADKEIIAEDIKNRLENMNYSVSRIVSNRHDAIKCASKLDIDLILMGVMLKGDIDGIETAKKIKERHNIPIIYLTTNTDKNTFERAKLTRPFGYLIEPLMDDKELQINIDIALYKHEIDSKIKHLGTHDSLTGLYNRAFFEDELLKLQKENKSHVGIIMSDLDGLKLVNDTLGHEAGDEALKCAAKIIKETVRAHDIVARIGGDEYAILFPDISRDMLKKIYGRIKKFFDSYTSSHHVLWSVSISFATNEETGGNISEAITLAEDRMYLEKLGRSYSSYSIVAKKILKKFAEVRDDITNHLHLDSLIVRFARKLSLTDQCVNDLCILAEFHDIGKVGIPDELLFRPYKLKKGEMRIMKRHPEIGYRIANSTSKLRPIAEFILKHHEWWNGKGYPFGIKGEKIPFESRVIAIVDAYCTMTHERPYKEAFSHEKALNEIKKGSGIQFDPYLVEKFIEMMEEPSKTL